MTDTYAGLSTSYKTLEQWVSCSISLDVADPCPNMISYFATQGVIITQSQMLKLVGN